MLLVYHILCLLFGTCIVHPGYATAGQHCADAGCCVLRAVPGPCGPYQGRSGSKYTLNTDKRDWATAEQNCNKIGGHLAAWNSEVGSGKRVAAMKQHLHCSCLLTSKHALLGAVSNMHRGSRLLASWAYTERHDAVMAGHLWCSLVFGATPV
jgi:hypothetical protein